ncbi:hypothetical protein AQUCO_02500075v1 [Aquilegia coerulea]|uniref:C-terminal processing peptidase n=1 Tax=Aquilegia coerulea TaxID=218851 RepID=A0A2G5D9A9_AQUCA|nr:hypothetical protein AQUCO_02500075v1 [Aquilegia coerulea]
MDGVHHIVVSSTINHRNPNQIPKSFSTSSPKILRWRSMTSNVIEARTRSPLRCFKFKVGGIPRTCSPIVFSEGTIGCSLFQPLWKKLHKILLHQNDMIFIRCFHHKKGTKYVNRQKVINWKDRLKNDFNVLFVRLVVAVLVTSISMAVNKTPSLALTEENILFLEAWKTIDRAYVDKKFNGQSWFRYRETALRNEPMNTREETYMAIRKMLATLDDPFTRFLEPEKFKSLRSGTQGALTGVGLSIGYPTVIDESTTGLVVISSTPGAPASRAGIISGDVILAIDGTSTGTMGIYDAAERLQGPDGSLVELTIRSGPEVKHMSLKREKVSLNPVKSRLCEVAAGGKGTSRIGYIKLTTFNQNASSAVKEAIETLRRNNVNAFVLDLRDNSGGLFPEGIEIAKICRGVRDIYEADGSDAGQFKPSQQFW